MESRTDYSATLFVDHFEVFTEEFPQERPAAPVWQPHVSGFFAPWYFGSSTSPCSRSLTSTASTKSTSSSSKTSIPPSTARSTRIPAFRTQPNSQLNDQPLPPHIDASTPNNGLLEEIRAFRFPVVRRTQSTDQKPKAVAEKRLSNPLLMSDSLHDQLDQIRRRFALDSDEEEAVEDARAFDFEL
ncbi:hypothetical protein M3Y99_00302700 [Aphelenchoides fujianensis]|nr:hypothetical protein M3Y99_00302700 [Aphelenchoides fujianensis]